MDQYVIGIDVGTGSARAGVFDRTGALLASTRRPIALHREDGGIAEQCSAQVWQAVCDSVRDSVAQAGVDPAQVAGLGFDATCSLAVIGPSGQGLPVGDPAHPERDIIVWMDHRAVEQAARINAQGHAVLAYVGGRISPEMQTPKLVWLREHRPDLIPRYEEIYARGAYAASEERKRLETLVRSSRRRPPRPKPKWSQRGRMKTAREQAEGACGSWLDGVVVGRQRRSSRCLHVTHSVARGKACRRGFGMGLPHSSHRP